LIQNSASQFEKPDSGKAKAVSDERLLALFVSGDDDALGELADRYEGLLIGLCTSMLGDRSLAMEAVQETWLRVIRHGRTYDGRASVKTWVYQIAINRCRDLGRASGARTVSRNTTSKKPTSATPRTRSAQPTRSTQGSKPRSQSSKNTSGKRFCCATTAG